MSADVEVAAAASYQVPNISDVPSVTQPSSAINDPVVNSENKDGNCAEANITPKPTWH